MADVQPFAALRPRDDLAERVIAPPYDVLTEEEAREIAREPASFVHVTRSEVDLPQNTDPHAHAAYAKARENLDAMIAQEVMRLDPDPTYYFYGQTLGSHRQVGVLGAASVAEYDQGLIRKHEYTRPDKEDDRTHHMEMLDAQVGLVFLAYRQTARLAELTRQATSGPPAWRVTTEDGVEHALWPAPQELVSPLRQAFGELKSLYIADGHHRSAAASRVHARRHDAYSATFLAGLYPAEELQVLAYNRVLHDLGQPSEAFLDAVAERFHIQPTDQPIPPREGTFTLYLEGSWRLLVPRPGVVDASDPVARLDVSVLQDHLLGPIVGIDDPRRSERLSFVGGIRGPEALVSAVDQGRAQAAVHMAPTPLEQLFEVADAGRVMPPKSTWFEPKLREGVAVRLLREANLINGGAARRSS